MLGYFGLTLFVSATLLFLVQPMIGKLLLPRLGGTPAVWNTCMVFFQAVLLVGYGYTHFLTKTQPPRRQILIQVVMILLPFLVLPFALGNWEPPTDSNPVFKLLEKLTIMVGLPFFAVSTTAPLLQKWFVHTGHPAAKDPYFLYGASNLGSMLGLALYPTVIEPWLLLAPLDGDDAYKTQVHLWAAGFALFVLLVVGCAIVVWSSLAPAREQPAADAARLAEPAQRAEPVTIWRRLRWTLLAAVPSSLMLGVTTYMTTDIASVAFFWILPLAMYLLTFIFVFARWPIVWTGTPHQLVLWVQPGFIALLVFKMVCGTAWPIWTEFLLHLSTFVVTTLMCHGELARDRPDTEHLTEFYCFMSLGGVLGGLFNALFAPMVLAYGIWEYPIAIAAACLLRANLVMPGKSLISDDSTAKETTRTGVLLDCMVPAIIGVLAYSLTSFGIHQQDWSLLVRRHYLLAIPALLVLPLLWRPIRFGLAVAAIFVGTLAYDRVNDPIVYEGRGFFGLVRVRVDKVMIDLPELAHTPARTEWRTYRMLIHGGINHGSQVYACTDEKGNELPALTRQKRRTPITYFHERNGVAEVYHKLSWPHAQIQAGVVDTIGLSDARLPASLVGLAGGASPALAILANTQSEPPVAVVGLGSGILACYAKPFQRMDFFEIDPLVKNLCVVPGYVPPWHPDRSKMPRDLPAPAFSFILDAQERGAKTDVILGDGRLKLKDAPDAYYHIISLDAFSSDAIPLHLLTAEAVALYMSKLVDGGVLVFNTTNAYVRIEGVLSRIALAKGYDCLHCSDRRADKKDHPERFSADWVVLRRRVETGKVRNGGPALADRLETTRPRLGWDGQPLGSAEERWKAVAPIDGPIWTDRYSNMLNPQVMPWLKLWGQ